MPAGVMLRQYHRVYRVSRWLRSHFTYTGHVVLIVMLLAAAFGIDTQSTTTYQLFVLLFILLVLAFANSLFIRFDISAVRRLPRYVTVGDTVRYRIFLTNRSRRDYRNLTLIDRLADRPPDAAELARWYRLSARPFFLRGVSYRRWRTYFARKRGAVIDELPVESTPPGSTATRIDAEITPLRRGRLTFDAIQVALPDRLGLYRRLETIPNPQTCLVLPRRHPVAPLKFPGRRKYQAGGVSLANSVGDSAEFVSLREYRKGDPLNRIHWKSFARHGELVVKEYQDEFFARRALILDTFAADVEAELFEAAVEVAASVCMSERETDSLLDLMFVGETAHCFTSGRGVDHMPHIQEVLASVQPSSAGFEALEEAVRGYIHLCSSVVCVLMAWDAPRRGLVRLLQGHSLPVAVFLVHDGDYDMASIDDRPEWFYPVGRESIGADLAAV